MGRKEIKTPNFCLYIFCYMILLFLCTTKAMEQESMPHFRDVACIVFCLQCAAYRGEGEHLRKMMK